MLHVIIGRVTGTSPLAVHTEQQGLPLFPRLLQIGWGDKKQTIWIDVTKWAKARRGLANHARGLRSL